MTPSLTPVRPGRWDITAYTLDTVQTVFVGLFCTLKSSMENPSLRVSGNGSSASNWKAISTMKDHVLGHETTMSALGNPESFRIVKLREDKVKEKEKAKVDSKELVMCTLVKNKHKTMICGYKKIVFGGPRARKARKAFRKERTIFLKVILVSFIEKKVQTKITNHTKERVKIRGEKENKIPFSIKTFCIRIDK